MKSDTPITSRKLLVISHDQVTQDLIRDVLVPHGWQITRVSSAADAQDAYTRERPTIVIVDVDLPGSRWADLCRELKSWPGGSRVPVLSRATSLDPGSLARAFEGGAQHVVVLPLETPQLASKLRQVLRSASAAEQAVRVQAQLERAQELALIGSWTLSSDGERMTASRMLCSMLGLGWPDVAITSGAFMERVHPQDRAALARSRQAALKDAAGYRQTYRVIRNGMVRTMSEVAQVATNAFGETVGIEGTTQDITEKVEAQRTISYLSRYNADTGLPNHAYFLELCDDALRATNRTAALLHIELDRYGPLSNLLGEAPNKAILRGVCKRIQDCVQGLDPADVASAVDAARAVGHTTPCGFSVLLPGVEEADASRIAGRILQAMGQPVATEGTEFVPQASAGLAMFPRDAPDAATLALCGRQAQWAASADSPGSVRGYDARMSGATYRRLCREAELRHAIANGQLRLAYQPKVDAASGRVVGAEALVRWMHPQRGLLSPDKFIPLAEESGLITPLTEWVLETTCADIASRHMRRLARVPVSVNFSRNSFESSGHIGRLRSILERHGVRPDELMIEVTETLLMKDVGHAIERIKALRADGFKLSLDDFGTGCSALSHLKLLQVDEVKIDRIFVAEVERGGRDAGIVRAITALGREFGIDVCAEGVETPEQAGFLRSIGCNLHQGFFYAAPLQAMEFENLLVPPTQLLPPRKGAAPAPEAPCFAITAYGPTTTI